MGNDDSGQFTETIRPATEPAEAAPSTSVQKGAYWVWVTNASGQPIGLPTKDNKDAQPDPGRADAVDIFFGVLASPDPPPKDQFELQINIDKVLRTCQRLYLRKKPEQLAKFRSYFTRLFRIAQLGLQGQNPAPLVAAFELNSITSDLLDDEAAAIKTGYMVTLGRYALMYSIPMLSLYALLRLLPESVLVSALTALHVNVELFACFLLLWVGCFLGVWLSYGIRKSKFSLVDLTTGDDDRLAPHIRLLFAGMLTMLIGILFALGLVQLSIGSVSVTDITQSPMLAFIVGAFCGISELALPASLGKRATTFIQSIK